MIVYELSHIFFRNEGSLIASPKSLGIFDSKESMEKAIQYFKLQPGFCDNPEAFSVQRRPVVGNVKDMTVFEAMVYYHTEDYECEFSVELGLFGDKNAAEDAVSTYCEDNVPLVNLQDLIVERIVNECVIGQKTCFEGFDIYVY